MRSLVTGSSGLLGRRLVKRLAEAGDELRLVDIAAAPGHEAHDFRCADASEAGVLDEAVRGVDRIFHLAAAQRMKPQFAAWSEEEIFQRNLDCVRRVLESAERNDVAKVVHVSSSGVYGVPRSCPVGEEHPREPLGAYGRSKVEAEDLCRAAAERGVDVTMLRPMSIFGPDMSGVFIMLFEWVRIGAPVYILGKGRNRIQTIDVDDLAEACVRAASAEGARGAVLNVGSDPATVQTVRETVRALVEHAGTRSPSIAIPAWLLRSAARGLHLLGQSPIQPEHYLLADSDFVLDIQAARQQLGWEPRRPNTRNMTDAYDAYVAAGPAARPRFHPLVRMLNRLAPRRAPA